MKKYYHVMDDDDSIIETVKLDAIAGNLEAVRLLAELESDREMRKLMNNMDDDEYT